MSLVTVSGDVSIFCSPAGGFFFAKPMRENNYVTMMDPFQKKYGNIMSSVLIFPTLVADVLWVARTLVSLGELLHLATLPGTGMCIHLCNPAGISAYATRTNRKLSRKTSAGLSSCFKQLNFDNGT